jgi:hypothetical protein
MSDIRKTSDSRPTCKRCLLAGASSLALIMLAPTGPDSDAAAQEICALFVDANTGSTGDSSATGANSFVCGPDAFATGARTTAVGDNARATGEGSTVVRIGARSRHRQPTIGL